MIVIFNTFIKVILNVLPSISKAKKFYFFLLCHIIFWASIRILSGAGHRAACKKKLCCTYVSLSLTAVHLAPRWDNLFQPEYKKSTYISIKQSLLPYKIIKLSLKQRKNKSPIVLNNVQLKPLNQSYKKVDQHPHQRNG